MTLSSPSDEIFRSSTAHSYKSITLLRILGSIGVVTLHCVGLILPSEVPVFSADWWLLKFATHFFSWSVLIFIMASGAVLLRRKQESLKKWYTRRFIRVGIPTLFWLIFYGLYFHFNRGDSLAISEVVHRLVYGPLGHLHFMVTISTLYIITPLLNNIAHRLSRPEFLGLTVIFLYISFFTSSSAVIFQYAIPYIGYFMLGSYLISSRFQLSAKVGVMILCIGSFLLTVLEGFSGATIINLVSSIFRMAVSVVVFLTIKNEALIETIYKKISEKEINVLSASSFGIYLVHPFVIWELFSMLKQNTAFRHSTWWISLALIPITYCISLAIVRLLHQNRFSKMVVGG